MTLSLLTPTGAVTTVPGHGVIAVRCFDYVGAARAGLSVITDGDSLAGDVVKEEQTIAVQSTFTSASTSFAAVSNTVSIPLVDFGLDSEIEYDVVVGMKMTGEAPSNAWAKRTWGGYRNTGASVAWGFGQGSSMYTSPNYVAREYFTEYRHYHLGTWYRSGSSNFNIRGWGVTGGNIAMYFDMLYLIPQDGSNTAPDYVFNDFELTFPDVSNAMGLDANGVVDPDEDDDGSSAPWLGDHSVISTFGFPFADSAVADMQEAEDELTQYDLNGFGQWDGSGDPPFDDIPDPPSWLAMSVGATVTEPHNIITDPLTSNTGSYAFQNVKTPELYTWVETSNLGGVFQPGSLFPGWYDLGVATLRISAASSAIAEAGATLFAGSLNKIASASGTDPRQASPVLEHLHSGILQVKMRINTVTRSAAGLGLAKDTIDNALLDGRTLAMCRLTAGGALDLTLESMHDGAAGGTLDAASHSFGGSPVSIDASYSAGDWFWIKVEKRGYYWRAKAWMDGGSEPGSWQVEGQEPVWARDNSTGFGFDFAVDHPYNTNWVAAGTAADQARMDPRGDGPEWEPEFPCIFGQAGGVGVARPNMTIEALDLTVDWDSDGSSPDDMGARVDKYDGTSLDGTVAVPYGPWRLVLGDARHRRWNADTNGINPWVWRDGGSVTLQTTALYRIWERRQNLLSFWGDIKHTMGDPRLSGYDV